MPTSAASTEILSILRHVTANKQNKAAARLATIDSHVRDAESAISSQSGVTDGRSLEFDVLMLLTTLRKAWHLPDLSMYKLTVGEQLAAQVLRQTAEQEAVERTEQRGGKID
ncbi:hypothetical protein J3458_013253 [Metarhizium acridum]|uniref:Uncharacterized protein n=1 Tax=Metarhizium acridum (strain CQMa 102) TaxID=655827 RepID=E9EIG9_METAQ|nr:uncharacterized protein MAC_09667 [Metarhizium acridum CQMa 102]EFY84283.1 hypothetical protein MAC_09667 [Metarhizium acridum CQMa 102]KAG8412817.1 hypothetical protein J3458_013253 [Metarhizium acridum]